MSRMQVANVSVAGAPAGCACFEATLSEQLAPGAVASMESFMVFADVQAPVPAQVEQGEPQLMLFTDNVYILSPYPVSAQTTEVGVRCAVRHARRASLTHGMCRCATPWHECELGSAGKGRQ
jgi:hypothetical protein